MKHERRGGRCGALLGRLGVIAGLAGLLFLAVGSSGNPAGAADIKKCDGVAQADIAAAAGFIDQNLDAIIAQFTHLSQKQRDEFKKKWPKVKVVCKDDGKSRCLKKPGVGGYAHGGIGNKIRICYYNSVDANASKCDLVGLMVHEMGHANGYPKMKGHNDPTPTIRAQDFVYRMGNQAEAFCDAQTSSGATTDPALSGVSQRAIGASCDRNDQCASAKCSNKGNCICTQDSHCASGEKCFKPVGKENYCERTDKPLGASCNKNSQCRSDKCEQSICVCKRDSDCSSGEKCFTPVSKKNYCERTDKPLGASCNKNSQCRSNKCEQDVCVCRGDSDCGAGQKCYTPVGKKNYCEDTSKPLGASCNKNSQCRSDKCEKNTCVCKKNSDCPTGQRCKTPIGKANYCK